MQRSVEELLLDSIGFRFRGIKELGDRTLAQLSDDDVNWRPNAEANSVAVIVQHMHGNMLSRWTDFLTTDGDKPWRNRDGEFTEPGDESRDDILKLWEEGWACTLDTLDILQPGDLTKEVKIRGQALGVIDAVLRQLAHYASHTGQLVTIAKERRGAEWKTLSIPRGESKQYTPTKRD